jgi:hypothetical protein
MNDNEKLAIILSLSVLQKLFCGVDNAAPIGVIVDQLVAAGVSTSRRHFQLKLKPLLLDHGYVVGACSTGMFLCCEASDFGQALNWYQVRVAAEQRAMGKIINALVRYKG